MPENMRSKNQLIDSAPITSTTVRGNDKEEASNCFKQIERQIEGGRIPRRDRILYEDAYNDNEAHYSRNDKVGVKKAYIRNSGFSDAKVSSEEKYQVAKSNVHKENESEGQVSSMAACESTNSLRSRRQRCSQRVILGYSVDNVPLDSQSNKSHMKEIHESDLDQVHLPSSVCNTVHEEKDGSRRRSSVREPTRGSNKKQVTHRSSSSGSASNTKAVLQLDNSLDTTMHQLDCHICGELVTSPSRIVKCSMENNPHYCSSCLRAYHNGCLATIKTTDKVWIKQDNDSTDWCCPKCLDSPFIRYIPFYRYGKETKMEDDSAQYLRNSIGLTGYLKNCGQCGVASSQHRVAIICDNCEREWHLQCLKLQDLPWGTWFCPDCLDLHICSMCVLLNRKTQEQPKKKKIEDGSHDTSHHNGKEKQSSHVSCTSSKDITVHFYHEGPLIICWVCYLRFHPLCAADSYVDLGVDLDEIGSRKQDNFWCCSSCQEYLGVHRIVSQRCHTISTTSLTTEGPVSQVQLLVKMKTQSYRRLMWLPLERVKAIYPTGVRKWLTTWEAERVMSACNKMSCSGKDETTDSCDTSDDDIDGHGDWGSDVDDSNRVEDEEDDTSETNKEETSNCLDEALSLKEKCIVNSNAADPSIELNVLPDNAVQTPSVRDEAPPPDVPVDKMCKSSRPKRVMEPGHIRIPSCVKKEWLIPSRVFHKRFCPRGTLAVEYYVKWCFLSYEESTWESFSLVQNTSALSLFRSVTTLEGLGGLYQQCIELVKTCIHLHKNKMIMSRPTGVKRIKDKDPTVPDFVHYTDETHPPPPKNATLVPNTKYIIQTSPIDTTAKSYVESRAEFDKQTVPSFEKRQRDVKAGGFAPYVDRPFYLSGYYLFDYQLEGINWLRYAWSKNRSVILADEMGLGKTIQVVSFLASLWNDYAVQGPFLVIAPLATLEDVWVRELTRWVPFINIVSYFGNPEARQICVEHEFFIHGGAGAKAWLDGDCLKEDRIPQYDRQYMSPRLPKINTGNTFTKFDVIVTSYEIFRKDHWLFRQIQWQVIIVDEGHRLKSFESEIKRALESCNSVMRVLLTGTPLQNSMDELFSLLNVLHPELFPESRKHDFQDMVTQEATIEKLKRELQLHILRRTKRDVMGGRMPAKKERLICVENTSTQREMYRNIILRNHVLLSSKSGSSNNPTKRSVRATSLRNVVMQMRKCCNHPYLFDDTPPTIRTETDFVNLVESSGKLHLLDRMLQILIKRGHRVLVFSQFMRMLNILEEYLNYRQYGFERLDGSTSAGERQRAIDRFNTQKHKKFVFLLSTRAGGLGINLTSADTVIIYDSDWNPHNDLQAQARAHRLGQTKKVAIYRFMTRATVEERIIETAKNKLVLDQVVAGRISLDDVEAVVRCGARELFDEGNTSKQVQYDDAQLEQLLSRDSDDDNNADMKEGEGGFSISETVLGSFKLSRFYEPNTENNEAYAEDSGEFWSNLLKEKVVVSDDEKANEELAEESDLLKAEGLGRGMRARREVLHFGQNNSRNMGISDDDDDDKDSEQARDRDEDDDGDDYSYLDEVRGNREGRSTNSTDTGKGTGIQGLKKQGKKEARKKFCFFDTYEVQRCVVVDGGEKGTLLKSNHSSVLVEFLDQVAMTRRQLGLAERAKSARRICVYNTPSDTPASQDVKLFFSDDANDDGVNTLRHAFDLDWNTQWLQRVFCIQLSDRTASSKPFIVQNGERYFLLCSPVHFNANAELMEDYVNENVFAAAMREIVPEELLRWRSQLNTTATRTTSGTSFCYSTILYDSMKIPARCNAASLLPSSTSYFHQTYPDYGSLRRALEGYKRYGQQRHVSSIEKTFSLEDYLCDDLVGSYERDTSSSYL